MIRISILGMAALAACVSCASHGGNRPYQPASPPEKTEFRQDCLAVYPDDVRRNPAHYADAAVVWAGIIVSTDAREMDMGDLIQANTVFEHHYFDWVQEGEKKKVKLAISPRGEGLFSTSWSLAKTSGDATFESAEQYAAKGKLAIVYGVPEKTEADGTVVLKYRYIRILDRDQFKTNEFDYGRFGDSVPIPGKACQTNCK
jgi:hypothetical protein